MCESNGISQKIERTRIIISLVGKRKGYNVSEVLEQVVDNENVYEGDKLEKMVCNNITTFRKENPSFLLKSYNVSITVEYI